MAPNLLIHSMAEFAPITLKILDHIRAKKIVEIGAEHGGNSKIIYDWVAEHDGEIVSIDPSPSDDFIEWLPTTGGIVNHIPKPSHDAIEEAGVASAWFIDGDHNWYTVYHELQLIKEVCDAYQKPMLAFLHDVSWPCARRDMYYAPDRIPQEFRQPYSYDFGVTLGDPGMIRGGMRGAGNFGFAQQEGGARNGVLTAVEDFVGQHEGKYIYLHVPAIFGLGILLSKDHPCVEAIVEIASVYHQNEILASLEVNRLLNYLKVIEWQDNRDDAGQSVIDQSAAGDIDVTQKALACINMVDEHKNDALVWYKALSCLPQDKEELTLLYDYFELLCNVPQDEGALEIIMSLQAISACLVGDMQVADDILSDCAEKCAQTDLLVRAQALVKAIQGTA